MQISKSSAAQPLGRRTPTQNYVRRLRCLATALNLTSRQRFTVLDPNCPTVLHMYICNNATDDFSSLAHLAAARVCLFSQSATDCALS